MGADGLARRLRDGPPLVLDGPLGTELERRGVDTSGPLWGSAAVPEAPDVVRAVHAAHRDAGAEVVTACTFRLGPRALVRAGLEAATGRRLAAAAVRLARDGAPGAWVAGSMGPAEDCYRPDQVPADAELKDEHGKRAAWLAAAGVDLILVETMNSVRESVVAATAARATGLPVWVSVVCGPDGRLLSGASVGSWAEALAPRGPAALLVNCTGLRGTDLALEALRDAWRGPWGAYPNRSDGHPGNGFAAGHDASLAALAVAARKWRDAGARVLGSCCAFPVEATRVLADLGRRG